MIHGDKYHENLVRITKFICFYTCHIEHYLKFTRMRPTFSLGWLWHKTLRQQNAMDNFKGRAMNPTVVVPVKFFKQKETV